jgi:hypothetical protein
MNNGELMNGRIRVVENIGRESEDAFGFPGAELDVVDGVLEDSEGFEWDYYHSEGFKNIGQINEQFSEEDEYQTVFELVED